MTDAGAQPTPPATLRTLLDQAIAAAVPDYTSDLPGALVEDLLSTGTGLVVTADLARVDAVNALSPVSTSPYVLAQLGQQDGIAQGLPTNTSVYVVFSGPAGYVISPGFIVSDGTYQYVVQDGGAITTSGTTNPLYCVANQSGSWAVPIGTVTTLVSSVPTGYTLTVTNPNTGTPGAAAESVQSFRNRVLLARQASAQGMADAVTSALQNLPGVTPRLVRVLQVAAGWEVLCGGGDPYAVSGAILQNVLDVSTLIGSQIDASRNVVSSLTNPPNSYTITYVSPPQIAVTMTIVWNTTLANFTAASQIAQLGSVAVQNYINTIAVGFPLSEFGVFNAFTKAIANVLPLQYLSTFDITVSFNGVVVQPEAGTYLYQGDLESYLYCSATGITVNQG
jgi:hypothetical protein